LSPSLSPSVSPSLSPSVSLSPSLSPSKSPSLSPSLSPSVSLSPSSPPGSTNYTKGNYVALPANDSDLKTFYSTQEITDVSTRNDVRVGQGALTEYTIHQYKDFATITTKATLDWQGQASYAPSSSTVYLQIYNRNTSSWETVASNNSANADTDFDMSASISSLTNYKDASNVISCRIYQLAP